jgi:ketosteroid isomerase-like protein
MRNTIITLALISLLGAPALLAQSSQANDEESAVISVLTGYAAAIESKDIQEIEKYVVTTDAFTVFEGGSVNRGWADYRDNHLAPELKEFQEIQYRYDNIEARVRGDMAYATLKYAISVKMKTRDVSAKGLATAVLVKDQGTWKITHMHTSRIRERRPKESKTDGKK